MGLVFGPEPIHDRSATVQSLARLLHHVGGRSVEASAVRGRQGSVDGFWAENQAHLPPAGDAGGGQLLTSQSAGAAGRGLGPVFGFPAQRAPPGAPAMGGEQLTKIPVGERGALISIGASSPRPRSRASCTWRPRVHAWPCIPHTPRTSP